MQEVLNLQSENIQLLRVGAVVDLSITKPYRSYQKFDLDEIETQD
jgi:hypothetical protein